MNNLLAKEYQYLLESSDEERMAFIFQYRWINYPRAKLMLDKLEELFKYGKNFPRITSLLIVGEGNNGKSSIISRFAELHPPYDYNIERPANLPNDYFDTHTGAGIPVVHVDAPNEPSESRLYSQILSELSVPYKETETVARKQYLVQYYLKLLEVEMLVIDEIHNILSGSIARQKQVLNAIKSLSNALQIPIVLSGTKAALSAINTDPQIESRFMPMYLPKWQFDDEFGSLLATYASRLPLKNESKLTDETVADEILELSDGYIGNMFDLLRQAAKIAIETKSERITLTEIRACNYVSPHQRSKNAMLEQL